MILSTVHAVGSLDYMEMYVLDISDYIFLLNIYYKVGLNFILYTWVK